MAGESSIKVILNISDSLSDAAMHSSFDLLLISEIASGSVLQQTPLPITVIPPSLNISASTDAVDEVISEIFFYDIDGESPPEYFKHLTEKPFS